jgi:prephenate dehydrogenase
MTRIAVYGFGLIGASVALALRERGRGVHVTAIDRSATIDDEAVRRGCDARVDSVDTDGVAQALGSCDLCVMATPISVIVERLPWVLGLAPVVTDCGSTKRAVARAAEASEHTSRFVPGHPLAGASVGGAGNARADLFVAKKWLLCPEHSDTNAVDVVRELIAGVGAEPVSMDVASHDRAVALTSHLPQLLSSALVVLSERRGSISAEGPGFASATRTAGANEAVWSDIFATNADEIAVALRELGGELERVAEELERDPPALDAATNLLALARRR